MSSFLSGNSQNLGHYIAKELASVSSRRELHTNLFLLLSVLVASVLVASLILIALILIAL